MSSRLHVCLCQWGCVQVMLPAWIILLALVTVACSRGRGLRLLPQRWSGALSTHRVPKQDCAFFVAILVYFLMLSSIASTQLRHTMYACVEVQDVNGTDRSFLVRKHQAPRLTTEN